MFYIFNRSGKCIASADFKVNEDDLATRGELAVEDERVLDDIGMIECLDGKICERREVMPCGDAGILDK